MKSPLQQVFLSQQVGHCARLVHAAVRPYYAKHMAQFDLKPSEFAALSLVFENPGASQRQVADAVMISPPNMASLMERLEERGLLRRQQDPQDKRLYLLHLTDAGAQLHSQASSVVQNLEERASSMLTPDEKERLLELLAKVIYNV
jgi:DNA-binding MarR family transcriptional regulator